MELEAGWVFLVIGLVGFVGVLRAKTFSFKTDSERGKTNTSSLRQIVVTPLRRGIGLALCCLVLIYGLVRIQQDHAWNPFHKAGASDTSN